MHYFYVRLLMGFVCCFGKVSLSVELKGAQKKRACEAGRSTLHILNMTRRKMLSWNYVSDHCYFHQSRMKTWSAKAAPFIRLFVHPVRYSYHDILNCLNSFDKTDRKCSLAPTDDRIRFWRSKAKVTAGCWGQILWTLNLMNYLSNLHET